jgi:hypothetical protein
MKPTEEYFPKGRYRDPRKDRRVGYLAKQALKYFFPGAPSVSEQLDASLALSRLAAVQEPRN